jgi:ABC-2 type transport system permease protein
MNIFWHELRAYRKSTLLWTLALLVTILVFMSLYPAFTKDLTITKKLLEGFPEPVRKAIGISLDSFFTLLGFYSFVFSYIILSGSIQAMNYGLSVLSKEVTSHTADFLLTKPIRRTTIMTTKLMAILCSLLFTNILYGIFAGGILYFLKTEPFSWYAFFLLSLSLFLIQLIFLALGVLISVIKPRIKSVITISLATVFGFFILDMFNSMVKDQMLRYIIPYKYFDPMYIIKYASYETIYLVITIVFVIAATLTSYRIYEKKDFLL